MQKTENYGLTLYDKEDKMSITAEENSLNSNMKIIDSELKKNETLTLGKNPDDGLIYIFKEGTPVGNGIEMGSSGDVVGYIDENNNIILSGELLEETYNVKYEMADGTLLDVGNISLEKPVEIINLLPISTDSNGDLFVGTNGEKGYKTGYRLSASQGTESTQAGHEVTGYIPVTFNDTVYLKNIEITSATTEVLCFYDEDYKWLLAAYTSAFKDEDGDGVYECSINGIVNNNWNEIDEGYTISRQERLRYMRFSAKEITDQSIVTVNQPIE